MRKMLFRYMLGLCVLLMATTVMAHDVLSQRRCLIEEGTVVEGALFVLCEELRIDGIVNGDVMGAAVRSHIDGRVNGNVYLITGQLDVRGRITKDLHFGGAVLRINPPPEGSEASSVLMRQRGAIKAASLSMTIWDNTIIADGIMNLGYQLIMHGDVESEVNFWGSSLLIDGTVNGDVYATVGNPESESGQIETLLLPLQFLPVGFDEVKLLNPGLIISDAGQVTGNLIYTGPVAGAIEGAVNGEIAFTQTNVVTLPTLEQPGSFSIYVSHFGTEFMTLMAIGTFGLLTVPHYLNLPLANLRSRPFASFSVGMLAFIVSFPIVLLVLLLSGLILVLLQVTGLSGVIVAAAIMLGLLNIGGMSIFYFVAIFVARVVAGLALGRFLLRGTLRHHEKARWEIVRLAAGVAFLAAIVSIPLIGLMVNAAALFLGLGAILTVQMEQYRHTRDTIPTPAPEWYSPSPAITRERYPVADLPHATRIMPVVLDSDLEQEEDVPDSPVPDLDESIPLPDSFEAAELPPPGISNLPEGFDFSFFEDD